MYNIFHLFHRYNLYYIYIENYIHNHIFLFIKGSLDEKLPSYEVLKMLKE